MAKHRCDPIEKSPPKAASAGTGPSAARKRPIPVEYWISQPRPAGKQEDYLWIHRGSVDRLSTNKANLFLLAVMTNNFLSFVELIYFSLWIQSLGEIGTIFHSGQSNKVAKFKKVKKVLGIFNGLFNQNKQLYDWYKLFSINKQKIYHVSSQGKIKAYGKLFSSCMASYPTVDYQYIQCIHCCIPLWII